MSKFVADLRVPFPVEASSSGFRDSRTVEAWDRVSRRLRAELGEEVFTSWFGRLELDGIAGDVAQLSVPTKFLKSWIQSHYVDRMLAVLSAEIPEIRSLRRHRAIIVPLGRVTSTGVRGHARARRGHQDRGEVASLLERSAAFHDDIDAGRVDEAAADHARCRSRRVRWLAARSPNELRHVFMSGARTSSLIPPCSRSRRPRPTNR